ncbi:MAG TPA: S-type pyocin family protein, partial [Brevundimonas sp.]|nr:S-type pyocin family protein [Brevundimonas sp.]
MLRIWMTATVAALGLAACGNGDSAVETRERSVEAVAPAASAVEVVTPVGAVAPVLTANRQETVDAKVARLFERNGADFNARTAEDYLERIERFTRQPPDGTERVERPNG